MNFFRAGGAHHLYDFPARRAADDGIVDQDHALSGQQFADGVELHLDAEVPDLRFWFDEGSADVVITDQSESEWNSRFLRIANRRRNAGVRNGDNQIGFDWIFLSQDPPHLIAASLDRPTEHHAVGPREINVLEDALREARRVKGFDGFQLFAADLDNFSRFDFTHIRGADEIEGTAFGCEHIRAVEFPDIQRPEAVRIADTDERIFGEKQQREDALNLRERFAERPEYIDGFGSCQKVEDDFAVARRLENRAVFLEPFAQRKRIDQIPVVDERNGAVTAVDDNGLSVAFVTVAGGGVSRVADSVYAFELVDDIFGENVRDIAHRFMSMDLVAVRRRNARAFLASVLQSVQSQVRHLRCVGMIRDPKDSAHVASCPLHQTLYDNNFGKPCRHADSSSSISISTASTPSYLRVNRLPPTLPRS